MKQFLMISFIFVQICVYGQEYSFKTESAENNDYYEWMRYLKEGPCVWLDAPEKDVYGYAYRFIITTAEIYDNIFIEKVSYGDEGSNKQMVYKRKLPLTDIFRKFGLEGEVGGVEFIEWIDSTSFVIKMKEKKFLVSGISGETIKVTRK